jgi:hypothetical protein
MIAGLQQRQQRGRYRAHPRREGDRVIGLFEERDLGLQCIAGRVAHAAVDRGLRLLRASVEIVLVGLKAEQRGPVDGGVDGAARAHAIVAQVEQVGFD